MNTQEAQKLERNLRILSSSKRGLCKNCWICCKNQQMLQKNFPTILWYLVYFQKFFLDVISTCSKEKPQKSWVINEKFSKDSIFMGKHGWHPLKCKLSPFVAKIVLVPKSGLGVPGLSPELFAAHLEIFNLEGEIITILEDNCTKNTIHLVFFPFVNLR